MKNRFAILVASLVVAVAFAAPASAGTLVFTGAPVSAGGVGVGLYNGTYNGISMKFVCDDFKDHISTPETWEASVGTVAPWSPPAGYYFHGSDVLNPFMTSVDGDGDSVDGTNNAKTYTDQQVYNMVAYLATQIYHSPTSEWGYLSFAIWGLTDGAYTDPYYVANEDTHIDGYLTAAYNAVVVNNKTFVATIYTPTDCTHNPGGDCDSGYNQQYHANDPPQEFIRVSEAGTPLLLGLAFFGGSFLRKKLLA